MGVHVAVVKTVMFGISAALAGVAGSVFVLRQTQANPDNMLLHDPRRDHVPRHHGDRRHREPARADRRRVRLLPGRRSSPATCRTRTACRGSSTTSSRAAPNLATVVFATLLILLMYVAPFGIVGLAKRIGRRIRRARPAPAGRRVRHRSEPAEAVRRRSSPRRWRHAASHSPTQGGPHDPKQDRSSADWLVAALVAHRRRGVQQRQQDRSQRQQWQWNRQFGGAAQAGRTRSTRRTARPRPTQKITRHDQDRHDHAAVRRRRGRGVRAGGRRA